MVLIMGIETSCDETGIAIVEDGNKIVSEKLKSSVDLQKEYGGVVPELASRVHVEYINILIKEVLDESGLSIDDIDAIAVASGPGLVGALLVGTMVAKTIGMVEKKKIVAVNHLEGHIFSSFLSGDEKIENFQFPISTLRSASNFQSNSKLQFPKESQGENKFLMMVLIVSGGHTELVVMEGFGVYKEIGSTIDDAAGEAFDKAAKILGLEYPGGPSIARSAMQVASGKYQVSNESQNKTMKLPRPMMDSGDYDFSFSGLKTALLYEVNKLKNQNSKLKTTTQNEETDLDGEVVSRLAWEFQEAVVDVLVAKTKKAMEEYGVERLAVVGGVAANKRLRERLIEEIDGEVNIPEFKYCTDNGVKIAVAGYYKYIKDDFVGWRDLEVDGNWGLG